MRHVIFMFMLIGVFLVIFISCSPTEPENPKLGVQPTELIFTKNKISDTLLISNAGGGELYWEITSTPTWLEVSKNSGRITTEKDSVFLTSTINQEAGQYSRTINIKSNGGNKNLTTTLNISVWIKKANMPTARWGHSSCVLEGKMYAIVGADGGENSYSEVDEYDLVTNTWSMAADFPTPRFNLAAAVVNGKIYVLGGHRKNYFSWIGFRTVEEYDPATDTWKEKTDIPSVLVGASSISCGDKIYVSGGGSGGDALVHFSTLYEYEPGIDTSN